MTPCNLEEITQRILAGSSPASVDEAIELNRTCSTESLCAAADRIRLARCGNRLATCSIVNARSGRCSEDCKWCAQSRHFPTGVREYEIVATDEALSHAAECQRRSVERISLVTSGRRVTAQQIDRFCRIYHRIAESSPQVGLCASMGLLGREELQALRRAGVSRYHCNLETSSDFFPTLCSSHSHADKLRTIALAREVGMEVCSGGIIGMGESMRQRLTMVAEAYAAGAVSIPMNILNPIPGTPLEATEPLSDDEIIRSAALMRFVAPTAAIRFAGGRARLSQQTTSTMLRGGINGVMVGDLLTTAGNRADEDFELFARCGYNL